LGTRAGDAFAWDRKDNGSVYAPRKNDMDVNVRTLTAKQARWIERCAKRLKQLGPLFTHMDALGLAFDLYRAWPGVDPINAADAFLEPEQLAA
jgi:hypothetical protein